MKRSRLLLTAAVVVLISVFGVARVAVAQGDEGSDTTAATEEPLKHSVEECIEQLEEANSIDVDCQEAPNQLLPETNEIIWGTFGFLVVFFFLWKFGLPGMKSAMNARTERIQGDLDAAESAKTEAEGVLGEYQSQLADARTESARIVEEARQAADEVRTSLVAKAEADAAEVRSKAAADAEAIKAQAMSDLRGEVAELAIGAAERILGQSLDHDTNVALVESYIDSVGAKS